MCVRANGDKKQVTDDRLPEYLNTGAMLSASNPTMEMISLCLYRHKPSLVVKIGSYCLPTCTSHCVIVAMSQRFNFQSKRHKYELLGRGVRGIQPERRPKTR